MYNKAQKPYATLCFSVPMATLCQFVAVAREMAKGNREVCCLLHEFHAMHAIVCAQWAARLPLTRSHQARVFFCGSKPLQPCNALHLNWLCLLRAR